MILWLFSYLCNKILHQRFAFNVKCLVVSIIYNNFTKNNEDYKIKILIFQYMFNAYMKI